MLTWRKSSNPLLWSFAVIGALIALLWLHPVGESVAAPLEFAPRGSLNVEVYMNWMYGRMGFEQESSPGVVPPLRGTLNDIRWDLGILPDQRSFRITGEIRPLEHHALRMYGSVPETYPGCKTLTRQLVTRSTIYPAGTPIQSQMEYASFGMGYDLDFLVGPRYFTGLNGDLKYLHSQIRLWPVGAIDGELSEPPGQQDVIAIDELLPCLGAHVGVAFPGAGTGGVLPGGFARITWGISPNYLNYVDISIGIRADIATQRGILLGGRLAYEHETFFHQQEFLTGKVFEFKRNGFTVSLVGTF